LKLNRAKTWIRGLIVGGQVTYANTQIPTQPTSNQGSGWLIWARPNLLSGDEGYLYSKALLFSWGLGDWDRKRANLSLLILGYSHTQWSTFLLLTTIDEKKKKNLSVWIFTPNFQWNAHSSISSNTWWVGVKPSINLGD